MVHNIIKNWKEQGIAINEGTSSDAITKLENQIGFKFPEDFKMVYQIFNGFRDYDSYNLYSILPLNKIKEEYENEIDEDTFIPICDFLIASNFQGYIKGKKGIYNIYEKDRKLCDNIYELIQLIDTDSDILL